MRFLSRAAALGLLSLLLATPALGLETSNSEFVIIREGDVLTEDLYAGAVKVSVEGTIDGDLIAFAADEVVVTGRVTGSITVIAPRVTVTGEVGGSLRVAANQLTIEGVVGEDLVAATVGASLAPGSVVEGDVVVWSVTLESLGSVGGNLEGSQRSTRLAGSVGNDVDITVGELEVSGPLAVGGDLGYRSRSASESIEGADVGGAVVHKTPLAPNLRVRALTAVGRGMAVIFLAIASLSAVYGWPERTRLAVDRVGRQPLRSWLTGAAVMASPLLLVGLTWLMLAVAPPSASFPLLLILIPLILALLGIVLATGVVSGAPSVGWLGTRVLRRSGLASGVVAGSAALGVLWFVPFVGWLVPIIGLPIGLGAWLGSGAGRPELESQVEIVSDS